MTIARDGYCATGRLWAGLSLDKDAWLVVDADRGKENRLREGANVVIDSVLSKPAAADEVGEKLAASGYEVEVVR